MWQERGSPSIRAEISSPVISPVSKCEFGRSLRGPSIPSARSKTTSEKSRTVLRTLETSSYTYFHVLRRPWSACKLFKVLVIDTVEVWSSSLHAPTILFNELASRASLGNAPIGSDKEAVRNYQGRFLIFLRQDTIPLLAP